MDVNNMTWAVGDYVTIMYYTDKTNNEDVICSSDFKSDGRYSILEKECLVIGSFNTLTIERQPYLLLEGMKFDNRISDFHIDKYEIDPKYKNKDGLLLPGPNKNYHWITKVRKKNKTPQSDGKTCCNPYCKEFCQYADSNLPNDKFICRSCRTNVVTRDLTLARLGFNLEDIRKL